MTFFETFFISPLANLLIVFYKILWSNMGIAIIVFSLFLKAALSPLSKNQTENAKKMKELAPKLEKLKKKHGDDKQKMAQAQSDFYKEHGINPFGGCLPQILQLVVLFAFFGVFTRTLYPGVDTIQGFNKLLYPPLSFESGEIVNTNFLYLDITKPDVFTIPSVSFPLPGPFLILAALSQLVSMKIMAPFVEKEKKKAEKTKEKSDDMQVAMTQSMSYMFPLMTLFIGAKFPSGLALYWVVFSLYQTYQQYKTAGWGGLTPWLRKLRLVQSN